MIPAVLAGILLCIIANTCGALTCEKGEKEAKAELDCDFELIPKKVKSCVCDIKKEFVRGPDGNCIPKSECPKSTESSEATTTTEESTTPKEVEKKKYCDENEELQPMLARDNEPESKPHQYPPYHYRHYYNPPSSSCDACKYNKCFVCKCKKGSVSKWGKCVKGGA